jgi:hypothetical protein
MSGTRVRRSHAATFLAQGDGKEREALSARRGEVEGEVLELAPLTSENDEKCSGGETRTHNLAVNSRLLCH